MLQQQHRPPLPPVFFLIFLPYQTGERGVTIRSKIEQTWGKAMGVGVGWGGRDTRTTSIVTVCRSLSELVIKCLSDATEKCTSVHLHVQ